MIPANYRKILEEYGMPLSDIGIVGVALDQTAALDAVEALREAGLPILGGDVYKRLQGNIKSTYDSWYCQKTDHPGDEEYTKQSWSIARSYIQNYNDPKDGSTFYSLIIPE